MHSTTLLILSALCLVQAAFNQTGANTTWEGNSIQPNNAGTFCYYPAPNQTQNTYCIGGHSSDPTFQQIINTHLSLPQGWSIAYYDPNNAVLGDQKFAVIEGKGTRECLSGRAADGSYQTLCQATNYDNNIVEPGSYCQVALGQKYVSDGCYTAMPDVISSSTTSSATSTSSSSGAFSTNTAGNASKAKSDDNGLDAGAIASLVVGVVGLILAAMSVWYARKQQLAGKPVIKTFKHDVASLFSSPHPTKSEYSKVTEETYPFSQRY